ncbi:MAG: sporulation protein YtfJ [Oscillibacter sp.]|nr:sporulation protein YtfJ [Oscillibacter sp.]
MDNTMDKKHPVSELMRSTIEKVRELADTNTIVGQPIHTPDGVTLIPISRISFGVGSGGGDYGKSMKGENFGGGGGAGVKIDPVAFLTIKDGVTRVLPVAVPPVSTVERIVDMVPDLVDKAEKFLDKKKAEKEQESL